MYRIVKSVSCTIPLKSSTLNDFGLLYDKNMTERIYTSPQNRSKTCKHFLQFILKAKLFLSQFVLLTFVCRRKTWFTLFIYLFICIKCSLSWHCCRTVVMDMPINDWKLTLWRGGNWSPDYWLGKEYLIRASKGLAYQDLSSS